MWHIFFFFFSVTGSSFLCRPDSRLILIHAESVNLLHSVYDAEIRNIQDHNNSTKYSSLSSNSLFFSLSCSGWNFQWNYDSRLQKILLCRMFSIFSFTKFKFLLVIWKGEDESKFWGKKLSAMKIYIQNFKRYQTF